MKSRAPSLATMALLAALLCVETMPITPELLTRVTRGYIPRSKVPVNFNQGRHEMIGYETRRHDNKQLLPSTGAILRKTLEELGQLIEKDIVDRAENEIRQELYRDSVFGFSHSGKNSFDFKRQERTNFVQSYEEASDRFRDGEDYNFDQFDRGKWEFEPRDIGPHENRDTVDYRDIMTGNGDIVDLRDTMTYGNRDRPSVFNELGDHRRYKNNDKLLSGYRNTFGNNDFLFGDEFEDRDTEKYGYNKKHTREPAVQSGDAGSPDVEKRGRSLWWYRNCNRVRRWRWKEIKAFVRSRRMCRKPAVRVRYGIYG